MSHANQIVTYSLTLSNGQLYNCTRQLTGFPPFTDLDDLMEILKKQIEKDEITYVGGIVILFYTTLPC